MVIVSEGGAWHPIFTSSLVVVHCGCDGHTPPDLSPSNQTVRERRRRGLCQTNQTTLDAVTKEHWRSFSYRQCFSTRRLNAIFSPTSVHTGLVRTILARSALTALTRPPVDSEPMFTISTSFLDSFWTYNHTDIPNNVNMKYWDGQVTLGMTRWQKFPRLSPWQPSCLPPCGLLAASWAGSRRFPTRWRSPAMLRLRRVPGRPFDRLGTALGQSLCQRLCQNSILVYICFDSAHSRMGLSATHNNQSGLKYVGVHLPIRPPGAAYCRSLCSANRETILEKMGLHISFPSWSLDTIPGRTSISWPTWGCTDWFVEQDWKHI